jgi:hypothetical protein
LTAAQVSSLAITGDYPDMTTRTDSLELNLVKDFNKNMTGRLMYRLDKFSNRDWHYDYLQGGPDGTANSIQTLSDMGPQNFSLHSIGAYFQYKF